jgi:NAD(P)-dependent dehydrogenase (short-subunit alcohol dehydrogenase family)
MRYGTPDDLIGAAIFLASDASNWMTGQTIIIDGGFTAL